MKKAWLKNVADIIVMVKKLEDCDKWRITGYKSHGDGERINVFWYNEDSTENGIVMYEHHGEKYLIAPQEVDEEHTYFLMKEKEPLPPGFVASTSDISRQRFRKGAYGTFTRF